MGANEAHLLISLATVEKHDPSKDLCFRPIPDDVRDPLGILGVIQVVIMPEPGAGRQVESLILALRFAFKSTCEPGLKLPVLMDTVVQEPETGGKIMNCDCKEFE